MPAKFFEKEFGDFPMAGLSIGYLLPDCPPHFNIRTARFNCGFRIKYMMNGDCFAVPIHHIFYSSLAQASPRLGGVAASLMAVAFAFLDILFVRL
jgi:hypothetical protein